MRTPVLADKSLVEHDVASLLSHFQAHGDTLHYHEIVGEQMTQAAMSRWPLLRDMQQALSAVAAAAAPA